MRAFGKYLALVIVSLFVVAAVLQGSIPQVATGSWQPADQMSQARTGATAVLLPDGRILIAGGTAPDGTVLSSAEFFNPDGTFSAAPPMSVARTGQAAVWMPNGEMLVSGGTTTGGGVTNSAEVFNPQMNTWQTLSATLVDARTGHTMVLLQSGDVLIVGGAGSAGPVSAIELFSAKAQQFAFAAPLATARTNAAAALLSDGRVFIVGGTGANGATLASSEIYDPANPGATTAGPALKTPRSGASATTMLHGTVLIAGGSYPEGAQNGAAELSSAEIFDPVAGTMTKAKAAMSAARTGQLAFLLPSNNKVLLVGGTYNGQPLSSAELYTPWSGKFTATSPMASARAGAVGSAMNSASYGAPYTVTGIDGLLLVAGGSNLSSAELYGFNTIKTDRGDYAPGTPVIMTGSGWKPGEKVTLYLHEDPQVESNPVLTTTADANGNINDSTYAPDLKDNGIRYYMTAVGSVSGLQAQTTFNDSGTVNITITGNGYIYGNASSPADMYCSNPANTPATLSGYTYNCSPKGHGTQENIWRAVPATGYTMGTWTFSPAATSVVGCTAGDTSCEFEVNTTTSLTVTFTASGATKLAFSTSAVSVAAGSCSSIITVQSQNSSGTATDPASTETVALSSSSGTGTFYSNSTCTTAITTNPTIPTTANSTSFYYKDTTAGTPTITATGTGAFSSAPTQQETVTAGAATKLVYTTVPTTGVAGTAFSVTVQSQDANGNPSSPTSNTTITLSKATGSGTLSGTLTGTILTTGNSVTIATPVYSAADTMTLTATATAGETTLAAVTSGNIVFSAGAATKLVYTTVPTTGTAGTAFSVTVQSQDANGNPSSPTSNTTITLSKATGSGTLSGTLTGTILTTGNSVTIATPVYSAADTMTLTATATAGETTLAAVTSGNIVFSAGAASKLAFGQQPGTTTAGNAISPAVTVKVEDSNGNVVTGNTSTVTIAYTTGGTWTSGSTLTASASSGIATFSNLVPTAGGSFTLAATDGTLTSATSNSFTVNKATPSFSGLTASQPITYGTASVTLSGTVSAAGPVYPASGETITVTINSTPQTTTTGANGSFSINFPTATIPASGTPYTITYSYAGDSSLNAAPNNTSTTLTVNKATPTLSVTNSPVTYNGAAQAATVSGSVGGSVTNVLYNGVSTATTAGTYAVTANFTPTDTTDYNSLTASSAGNFIINKATPTLTVSNSPVTYNGLAQAATVSSGSVGGSVSSVLYNGVSTVPTTAGTYAVTANFTPTDTTDYNSLTASSAGNFIINKATPTLTVSNSPVTYNGLAQAATVSSGSVGGSVSSVLYNGVSTVPTTAGTYAVTANFTPTDTTDYNSLTASSAGNFIINKATPTLTVSNSPVTYNGSAQAAAVSSGSVGGSVSSVLYNGVSTVPTTAGTYAVTANFTPTDTTDYNSLTASSAGNFIINKATPTLSVTNSPVTYNGLAQAATVSSGSVGGSVSSVLYNGVSTVPTTAGTYAVTANFTPTDTTDYNSLTASSAGNFIINKATPTLTVSNSPVTYNGSAQAAAVSSGSVGGSVSSVLYNGVSTVPTTAGTYAVTANFTPTDTTDYNSLTASSAGNFIINKATPTLTVSNSPVTYNGLAQAATVSSGSVGGSVSSVLYNGVSTVPTTAGTYAVTANFTPTDTTDYNSLTASSAGNFIINKATPTLTVTNSPVTYNGSAQAAAVSGSVGGTVGNIQYNGSSTVPTNAGTYAITANFTPTDTTDYNSLTASSAGNFVIAPASTVASVSCTVTTFTYTGSPITPACTASVSGPSLSQTLTVWYSGQTGTTFTAGTTPPTNAGSYYAEARYNWNSSNSNYLASENRASFVINPVSLAIYAWPRGKFYGQTFTFAGTEFTAFGLLNGDTVSSVALTSSGAVATAPPGLYPITASAAQGTGLGNYTISYTGATLTVNAAKPVITWAQPGAISYGTPLDATILNATASVSGTFTYSPGAGSVLAGGSHTLTVTFTPTDTTDYIATTASVTLQINPATPTIVWATPVPINYGTGLGGAQLNAKATLNGATVGGTYVYTQQPSGTVVSTGTVLSAGTQTLSVAFTPTLTADYTTAAGTVTLQINQVAPKITWPNQAAITYGTPLSATQLSATASVPGTYVYLPAAGAVLSAGAQTLSVTFTPSDATDYTTVTATTPITVNKAATTITWATPAAIPYGTPLSATQLNATASVPGTFVYSPAAGAVLAGGSQKLSVTFTPSDATDNTTATASVMLTVGPATPTITWGPLAAINYGTALGGTQLNAKATLNGATVSGTYVYTLQPAGTVVTTGTGTVLPAGQQTLSVTFTPTVPANYTANTGTVTLQVNQVAPKITWANPAAITYGTLLSATQLNATASVPGTFTYTPAVSALLPIGPQTLSVSFTPTDATDYTTGTATATITVNKARPVITWAPLAAITYGTPLSATQLDATASVPGTFTYSAPLGSVLAGGSQTLIAYFTPSDTTDYIATTASVTLQINPATLTIVWATPAPITYGIPLGGAQLNAKATLNGATVGGTYVYTVQPAGTVVTTGTVLPSGVQNLSVTFTPTLTADYTTATGSVQLQIN